MKHSQTLLLLTLSLIFYNLQLKADSIVVSGIVSGSWNVDTVMVEGNIQVRETSTLDIMPGTLVLFGGAYFFDIKGSLKAIGSAPAPIHFSMADTTGFHNDTLADGGWKQIRIENTNQQVDSVIFSHCVFQYGKALDSDSLHGYGGALCIRNSHKISISNCSFQDNYAYFSGGAVYLENANIRVSNNSFTQNRCGQPQIFFGYGGGLCSDKGTPAIHHNYFSQNASTGIAGGLCVRFKDCPVSHNIFDDNFSALGGGFGILHIDSCKFLISNNLIINNSAAFFGAGISNNDCSPTYVNNTIVDNHCVGGGGGLYCKDSVVPLLHNNILYGNTQYGGEVNQVYLWDLLAQPDFYYNNIEGGFENFDGTGGVAFSGTWENNLDEDPLFESGSYLPTGESACVDAGNPDTTGLLIPAKDIYEQTRLVGPAIDIGAAENQNPLGIPKKSTSNDCLYPPTPNPSRAETQLAFYLEEAKKVTFFIVDYSGRLVKTLAEGELSKGRHTFTLAPQREGLEAGIYFCVLKTSNHKMNQKIIVIR